MKKEILYTMLNQIIDLKAGHLDKITTTQGEYADAIQELIIDAIDHEKQKEQAERTEAELSQV